MTRRPTHPSPPRPLSPGGRLAQPAPAEFSYQRGREVLARQTLPRLPDTPDTFFDLTGAWRLGGPDGTGPRFDDTLTVRQDDVVLDAFCFVFSPYGWIRQDIDPSGCRFAVQIERAGYPAHREWCRATTPAEAATFAARFLTELAAPLAQHEARVGVEDHTTGAWQHLAGPNDVPLASLSLALPAQLQKGVASPVVLAWKPPADARVPAVDLVVLAPGMRVTPASVRVELPRTEPFRATVELTPLREGSFSIAVETLIQGDPVQRCDYVRRTAGALRPTCFTPKPE